MPAYRIIAAINWTAAWTRPRRAEYAFHPVYGPPSTQLKAL